MSCSVSRRFSKGYLLLFDFELLLSYTELKIRMDAMEETVAEREYRYTVFFEPAEEGGYIVTCPALPGMATEGETLEEARAMAKDAIRAYLESLRKDGLQIPPDKDIRLDPVKEELTVDLDAA